jgi:hypothetical protein
MIGRPCKPDPDLNWLWRTLLPNTPMPACDSSAEATPVSIEDAAKSPAPAQNSRPRKDLSESSQSQ